MEKKLNIKKRRLFLLIIILISIVIILYSLINIAIWFFNNYNSNQEISQIEKDVIITEIENDEVLEEEIMIDEQELLASDPYWNLKKMSYLAVDFSNLEKTNTETVAWVSVPDTNINYPIVQHADNKYYLNHSFDSSKNEAGWIFMDYRNSLQNLGKNTIIYGHTRKDGSMFGTLKNVLNSDWYENENNYAIKVSTKYENSLWQVFSVYCIPTTSDYIQTEFVEESSFEEFLNIIKKRSIYDFKTTVNVRNKVITLSTCHNRDNRIVLHAKLIKSQKKNE